MNNLKLKIDQELKHMKKLANDPTLFLTIIFSLIVISFFVLVPLYNVLKESFTFKEAFSFENYIYGFHGLVLVQVLSFFPNSIFNAGWLITGNRSICRGSF
jgi:hypothetical protein